ncbi:MAG: hypothetical protein COA79_19885 [Planctomycetota bacterium]|nr:MAG: hypothetical protein COA79_19885 [Planctomycetota bacterium]
MVEFSFYQLLTPAFSILLIFHAISRYSRSEQTFKELLVWTFVWSSMALVAIYPELFVSFAEKAGFRNGVFGIVFFCIILVFFIVFKLLLFIERLERKLADVVRHIALYELDQRKYNEEASEEIKDSLHHR